MEPPTLISDAELTAAKIIYCLCWLVCSSGMVYAAWWTDKERRKGRQR